MVDIQITIQHLPDLQPIPWPSNWKVGKTQIVLRDKYGFIHGAIELNGRPLDPDETFAEQMANVEGEVNFVFVNGISTLPTPAVDYKEIFEQMKLVMTDTINSTLNERERDKEEGTVVISEASQAKAERLYSRIGFVSVGSNPPECIVNNCQPFDWQGQAEDLRTPAARDHLQQLLENAGLNFATDFQLIDTHKSRSLLNFEDKNIGKISGGTDLIITPKGTGRISYGQQMCVLFELKTSQNIEKNGIETFIPSAVVEFISANCISHQPSILTVLTDLNNNTHAWKSYYDLSGKRVDVDEYENLTLDQMISLVAYHLNQHVVKDARYSIHSSSDAQGQRYTHLKRKFDDSDLKEALDRFEDMAEGTADWSRDRALATWDFLQNMGVERMPATVKYSMMYA